jgi:hypothetical protein
MSLYVQTNTYLDNLKREFPDHTPLILLYMWDIIRDVFNDLDAGQGTYSSLIPVSGTTLEDVWNKFIKDPWGGFDVDEGNVVDWLSYNDLIQEEEDNG